MSFESWFQQIAGTPPYPYQVALATAATLPDLLSVPTGAGKTAAAVLAWLWRRRVASLPLRAATPRRLVFCLPMRTLVEQTVGCAARWLERAGLEPSKHVFRLLGGAVEQDWDVDPAEDVILVGTQDLLLSRALNRGYAMSRFRWPWHFGLLNSDCLWVMDEVQLMGVGLTTSAQLQGLRERMGTALPTRTLWMSATLAEGRLATVDLRERPLTALGLEAADREHPALGRRLTARKRLVRAGTTVQRKDTRSDGLATEVLAAHRPDGLTLVVVNRVRRAQDLFAALRRRDAPFVGLLHSRFRPAERLQRQAALLDPDRPFRGILVATQAIEAGVDISARTLFTELASWPSLVQRFGRCNRGGEHEDAEVRWIDVVDDPAPYTEDALQVARAHLAGLTDVGPAALARVPQEDGAPELPAIRRRDLVELFDTAPDLAGHDIDVGRYIRADEGLDVQVAWRRWPGAPDEPPSGDAPALHRDELCRVPLRALRDFLKKRRGAYRWSSVLRTWERVAEDRLVPGASVLLAAELGGYHPELGWTGDPVHVPEPVPRDAPPEDDDAADQPSQGCGDYVSLATHAQDVAEELHALATRLGDGPPWARLERAARWHDLGKVHPAFQAMLLHGLPADDARRAAGPWAKSAAGHGAPRCLDRPGFRHELASALAFLAQGADDLEAYLVAAHHGKVRLSIRTGPNETAPPGAAPGQRFARGVLDGEELPGADLGEGVAAIAVPLSLAVMEIGAHDGHPSWSDRVTRLRDELGVFRLAYYEALVRAADARGSKRRAPRKDPPRA